MERHNTLPAIFFALLILPVFAFAADADESAIVATVGNDPIDRGQVERMMDLLPRDKRPTGELLAKAQAQMLEEMVNRWLVIAYARRVGGMPSAEELAKAKKQLQARFAARGRKPGESPGAEPMTDADLDRHVLWRLVWDRYLARYRTPERRKTWFQEHHRELDGTEMVVSHILLRPSANAAAKDWDALEKRAEEIRTEIESGKLDFAAAAAKYSDGPSGKQGGRLGKIGRHGPMEESFSRAAFALEAGKISPPVRSPFGVHLIRCESIVPGTKPISECRADIDTALAGELLARMANLERQKTPVKYTGAWPHFKPGTTTLEGEKPN